MSLIDFRWIIVGVIRICSTSVLFLSGTAFVFIFSNINRMAICAISEIGWEILLIGQDK